MKILVSNDDGAHAKGIHVLAKELADAGHDVVVCAPDRERSASGHSMTMTRKLFVEPVDRKYILGDYEAYECDGMPTDCVSLAYDVLGYRPELLISGINFGPNVADDITYSGTVCAAMEGIILHIPSAAVSLNCEKKDAAYRFETAAAVTLRFVKWFEMNTRRENILYNINVPNVKLEELKGICITRQGVRLYEERVTAFDEPEGPRYLIGGVIVDRHEEGTDVTALRDNYVSITPLKLDMTDHNRIKELRGKRLDLILEDFLQ